MNLMRGFGGERADQVIPGALDWLERRGKADDWFLHVHLWDPHTPYRTPEDYGNPFESTPFLHGIQKMFAWRIGIYQVHIPLRNHGASDPMNGESHHLGNHGMRPQWMQ